MIGINNSNDNDRSLLLACLLHDDIIMFGHHVWSSCLVIMFGHHVWSSGMLACLITITKKDFIVAGVPENHSYHCNAPLVLACLILLHYCWQACCRFTHGALTCRVEISDSISETGRRKKRQVAHHLGNAKRSIGSHSIQDSESDSEDELGSPSSSSQAAAESRGQHDRQLGTDPGQGAMLQGSNAVASQRGMQHGRQQQAYSTDEDDMR